MRAFDNAAVLVTGSSRGIGRAIARCLHAHGVTVGVHGRDMADVQAVCDALDDGHGRTIALAADLSEPAAGAGLVRQFLDAAGRLDGLVNNAGGGRAVAFRGLRIPQWRATFAVNLEALMSCCREAYVWMRQHGGGGIVNVASLAAHGPGKWMGADYAASKAGVVSLTKSLAFEAARFGVRVNAVSPGFIDTDMTAALSAEHRARLRIPMGRLGTPAEVAEAVLFLLGPRSSYVTGQVLHIDGGLWMGGA